ncbi:hypothetical protein pb186bvf_008654 [Paramecium bursaria]
MYSSHTKIHSNASLGKLKKGTTFQFYPFHSIDEYNPNLQVRPFTSIQKPPTAQSIRQSARAATSQTQRQSFYPKPNPNHSDLETRQSKRYNKIYFVKANYKTVLQNHNFNSKIKALPPNDFRIPTVREIVQDKFQEITIKDINLLICQHQISEKFYVYFSGMLNLQYIKQDAEWIPFSTCCHGSIFLMLSPQSQNVEIYCCNCSKPLQNPLKIQSAKSFKPGFFLGAQEQRERQKVSRMIVSGQFRKRNLKQVYLQLPEQQMNFDETLECEKPQQHPDSTIVELQDLIQQFF